jgi:hypothetical protein
MTDFDNFVSAMTDAHNQDFQQTSDWNNQEEISEEEYQRLIEIEKIREQNPQYLAEKERIAMQRLVEDDYSPYNHPCQNDKNTVSLVSSDKAHEIDIEFDRENKTALLNIINVDPIHRTSFVQLLFAVQKYLKNESIEKAYQNVMESDWDLRLSTIDGFHLVRKVESNAVQHGFVIVETDTVDVVTAIGTAMGMDVDSHLDETDQIDQV